MFPRATTMKVAASYKEDRITAGRQNYESHKYIV